MLGFGLMTDPGGPVWRSFQEDNAIEDQQSKFARGMKLVQRLFPGAGQSEDGDAAPMPPEFMRHTVGHLFGDVWQGDGLTLQQRSLITCTSLVALGREAEQRLHFVGAKNLGLPRSEIEAMITHVAHYAGWPVAVSAFRILSEVWPEGQPAPA